MLLKIEFKQRKDKAYMRCDELGFFEERDNSTMEELEKDFNLELSSTAEFLGYDKDVDKFIIKDMGLIMVFQYKSYVAVAEFNHTILRWIISIPLSGKKSYNIIGSNRYSIQKRFVEVIDKLCT